MNLFHRSGLYGLVFLFPSFLLAQTDVFHLQCHWRVNPVDGFLAGWVKMAYKPIGSPSNYVVLALSDTLVVDSVKRGTLGLAHSHLNNQVIISTPLLQPGQSDTLSIYYHGYPERSGTDSYFTDYHFGKPILWTLSEPFGAHGWWPCRESLSDKVDSLDVIIQCDTAFRAASNGLLVSETILGSIRTSHWKHRYPITEYLIAMAVAPYIDYMEQVTLSDGTVLPIHNMIVNDPANISQWQAQLPQVLGVITWLDTLLVPYPFLLEKYGHAQIPTGGGMEHQTMTFLNYPGAELFAHEAAHQWFGNRVTCGSWHDIWLNEGFANYFGGLAYQDVYTGGYFKPWLEEERGQVFQDPGGSVYCPDTTDEDRIFSGRLTYAKAGMVVRMLEWELGRPLFLEGLRAYLNAPDQPFALTGDLQALLETSADTSLAEFFADWVYGEGYPLYSITWQSHESGLVEWTIHQAPSHPSVSFFEARLPFRFSHGNVDTTLVVHHSFSGQHFSAQLPFEALEMSFDPDLWVLAPTPQILRQPVIDQACKPLLFPNPCRAGFFVAGDQPGFSELEILDAQSGKVLWKQSLSGHFPSEIKPTPSLEAGFYLIRITNRDHTRTEKLLVLNN